MSIPVKCLLVLVSCTVFNTRLRQIRLGLLLDTYKKVDRANLQFLVLLVTSSPSTAEFVVAGLIPSCATVFLGGSMIKKISASIPPCESECTVKLVRTLDKYTNVFLFRANWNVAAMVGNQTSNHMPSGRTP